MNSILAMKQKDNFEYPNNYVWAEKNIEKRDKLRQRKSFLQVMSIVFLLGFICGSWAILVLFKVEII